MLRFASEQVWRSCCDPAVMLREWGPEGSRALSHRLQQLDATATLDDLAFLPVDVISHEAGVIEISVTDRIVLFVEPGPNILRGGQPINTVTVTAVRDRVRATTP